MSYEAGAAKLSFILNGDPAAFKAGAVSISNELEGNMSVARDVEFNNDHAPSM